MLAGLRRHLGMPLLAKELTEQAARPRTYIVRFLYTAVLFSAGLFIIYGRGATGGVAQLGQGQEMFDQMFRLQLGAILLVLPATCAGAFAGEKERESLSLLLLTTIPRGMIVLQKLLSRVIPMLAFVVLSFPLMATAYSFGGVQTTQLYFSLVFLTLLTVYVGTVSIMCSTYCRTTVEAYVATYLCLLGTGVFLGPAVPALSQGTDLAVSLTAICFLFAPFTLGAYLFACVFLYDRAFIPPKNLLLALFKEVDRVFHEMNTVTGGVVLVKDGDPFPANDPIRWRETAKRSLGTFRYLFRILVVIELPILCISQMVNVNMVQTQSVMSVLLYILWVIALLLTTVHSASVVSTERSRQTLDVLLVSPIAGRQILSSKLSGVRRLFWILMVPFSTIFLFQHWFHGFGKDIRYLILCYGSVFTVLPLVMWLGLAIGMWARSQMRAIITLLSMLVLVTMSGPLVNYTLDLLQREATDLRQLTLLTPANWVMYLEQVFPSHGATDERWPRFWGLGGVILLYGVAAVGLRWWILSAADAFLGRVREGEMIPPRGDDEEGETVETPGVAGS